MSVKAAVAINGAEVHHVAVEGGADLQTLLNNIQTVKSDVNRILTEKIDEEKAAGNGKFIIFKLIAYALYDVAPVCHGLFFISTLVTFSLHELLH
jgi:hypothetical protein